ncbi:hypothetical protein O2K51_00150 [Apibacter raozihei]|uniref:hypothetical protein n=1 Tax=Apibacter TaxID=1778601 RepID=UPI000FE3A00F|nr:MULTISPECIES: hypothetical protein [Apibacter]
MITKTTKILFTIWFLCNLISCGQKKEAMLMGKENFLITEDNLVPTLLNDVKKYSEEPLYYLHIVPVKCDYEILINDFPIYNSQKSNKTRIIYINQAILQTGLQKISYYLYPEKGEKCLVDSSELQISICKHQANKNESHEVFMSFPSPKIEIIKSGQNNKQISEASGHKIYKNNLMFHAEVPYKIKGWSNGQYLKSYDSLALRQAVIDFYKSQWENFKHHKKDEIFSLFYKKEKERIICEYNSKKHIDLILKSYSKLLNNTSFSTQSLDKYKISFYGNGKLVRLERKDKDSVADKYLSSNYENTSNSNLLNYYLYLPKGKNLNNGLEIIR